MQQDVGIEDVDFDFFTSSSRHMQLLSSGPQPKWVVLTLEQESA